MVQKTVLGNNHPVRVVGQGAGSQAVIPALYYRLQTGRRLNSGEGLGGTLLSSGDEQHPALRSQSLGVRQAKLADGKYHK